LNNRKAGEGTGFPQEATLIDFQDAIMMPMFALKSLRALNLTQHIETPGSQLPFELPNEF
jgi:hypothetical protein